MVAVRSALQAAGIDYESADIAFVPTMEVPVDEEHAKRVFRVIDALEDSDDVQDVYANYSVSDDDHGEARLSLRPSPAGPAGCWPPPGSRWASARLPLGPARPRWAARPRLGPARLPLGPRPAPPGLRPGPRWAPARPCPASVPACADPGDRRSAQSRSVASCGNASDRPGQRGDPGAHFRR